MSSIRKVKTKTGTAWQARWRERGRARAKNFASKRAASAHAARMAELVERRGVGDVERLSTAGWLGRFVDELAAGGEHSPVTVSCYRRMTGLVSRVLGEIALSRLTTAAIDDGYTALLVSTKPLKRSTVRFAHRVLVIALNRAVRRGLIPHNPALNASLPGSRNRKPEAGRKLRAFSSAEVTALLAAAAADQAPDMLVIVSTLLATGLRRAELLGLTLDDVDIENNLLHVRNTVVEVDGQPVVRNRGKSAAALRTLALPPTVVTQLRAQRARVQEAMLAAGVAPPAICSRARWTSDAAVEAVAALKAADARRRHRRTARPVPRLAPHLGLDHLRCLQQHQAGAGPTWSRQRVDHDATLCALTGRARARSSGAFRAPAQREQVLNRSPPPVHRSAPSRSFSGCKTVSVPVRDCSEMSAVPMH